MRLMIAAGALLLLATPALAQRVDTRRIDIREMGGTVSCNFTAIEGLTLSDGSKNGKGKAAIWTAGASQTGDAQIQLFFTSIGGRELLIFGLGMEVKAAQGIDPATVTAAKLFIDGRDANASILVNASGGDLVLPVNRDLDRLGMRVFGAKRVEVEIFGPGGTPLHRYSWDTSKLKRVPELLELVEWGCTTPDRG